MKLPVHRNVEPDGVEPDRRGGVLVLVNPLKVVVNRRKVLVNPPNVVF